MNKRAADLGNDISTLKQVYEGFLRDRGAEGVEFEYVERIFKSNPWLVDFYVQKWHSASEDEKYWLLLLILIAVPIKEVIDWGWQSGAITEEADLTDMGYPYVRGDGTYDVVTFAEYPQWLARVKAEFRESE